MLKILFALMLSAGVLYAKPVQVKLSQFKPTAANAGTALQKAIDSGAAEVIVDNPGYELITFVPIKLRSNQKIIFRDGVVLSAAAGRFKSDGSALFSGMSVENLEIRGEGNVVLKMRKKDYQDQTKYDFSEWRHLFNFKGCERVVIKNLTLLSSGGDGIYLGTNKKNYNKDMLFEDLKIKDHHRQGISIISAENVTIRRCELSDTAGTAPAAGIDFEPNSKPSDLRLVNILLEDCIVSGNQGNGLELYTPYIEGKCRPLSITFRRCRVSGNNKNGTVVSTSWHRAGREKIIPPRGNIVYEDCIFENNARSEICFSDQHNVNVKFKNCRVRPGKNSYPIRFAIKNMRGAPINNIHFDNLVIENPVPGKIIAFKSWGDAKLDNITGTIFLTDGKKQTAYDLQGRIAEINQEVERRRLKKFTATVANVKKVASNSGKAGTGSIRTRGDFTFVCSGKPGDKVTVNAKVIRASSRLKELFLCDHTGRKIATTRIGKSRTDVTLEFTMPARGFAYASYRRIGGGVLELSSNTAWGITPCRGRDLIVPGKSGKLSFTVKKRTGTIKISSGSGSEITIRDSKGAVRFSRSVDEPVYVDVKGTENGEVWTLEFKNIDEEKTFQLQTSGIDGIFAPAAVQPPRLKTK